MIVRIEAFFRKVSRTFSRDEWVVRLLNRPRSAGQGTRPGLVLIQIDGLGLTQMQRAMQNGNMPFLNRLLRKEGYLKYRHYTGLPSTLPRCKGCFFTGSNLVFPPSVSKIT